MKRFKLIFFVPKQSANFVKDAIFKTGAGKMGNYSHCCFETSGVGQFKPLSGATPTIGSVDNVERVEELKIEILVLENQMKPALKALKNSHPYEEIAFEIIKLDDQFTID
jgi:hypothetical protein